MELFIQTIENQHLIQRCISKSWTLQQFLTDAGQIEDVLIQVHNMKADQAYQELARIKSRRNNQKSRDQEFNERDKTAKNCTYCGLTEAHQRGKHCPAYYGTQCNIGKKFNHFSSVCRDNFTKEAIMDQKSPRRYTQKN